MANDRSKKADAAEAGDDLAGEVRTWSADGWSAQVVKNEDDEGWAVVMQRDGDAEPALVTPWVMGRDKKNPKPLDAGGFRTLVKAASDVLTRHEQQRRANLHKSVDVAIEGGDRVRVDLDSVPDEDDPHALLSAWSADETLLARVRAQASYKLSTSNATKWVKSGYRDV
jgi:hypothetical protein